MVLLHKNRNRTGKTGPAQVPVPLAQSLPSWLGTPEPCPPDNKCIRYELRYDNGYRTHVLSLAFKYRVCDSVFGTQYGSAWETKSISVWVVQIIYNFFHSDQLQNLKSNYVRCKDPYWHHAINRISYDEKRIPSPLSKNDAIDDALYKLTKLFKSI